MLTQEQVDGINQEVVERHRRLYSDDELWEILFEREDRMASIARTMAKIGTLLSTGINNESFWQSEVNSYAREYAAHLSFAQSVASHLEKRGFTVAAKWREGWRDFECASALDNWSVN